MPFIGFHSAMVICHDVGIPLKTPLITLFLACKDLITPLDYIRMDQYHSSPLCHAIQFYIRAKALCSRCNNDIKQTTLGQYKTRQVYNLFQQPVQQEVEIFYKGESEVS